MWESPSCLYTPRSEGSTWIGGSVVVLLELAAEPDSTLADAFGDVVTERAAPSHARRGRRDPPTRRS
jgi:hypothetical protein